MRTVVALGILYCTFAVCESAQGKIAAVKIFKSPDSRQCLGGGIPIAEMRRELRDAGVTVKSSACGRDGRIYPAVCDAPDGAINIFTIPVRQLDMATALSYTPLSTMPSAVRVPCKKPVPQQ